MIKAHKIRLNPTLEQTAYFRQASAAARFAFNWGLERYNRILDHNRLVKAGHEGDLLPVSGRLLKKEFNQFKPAWVSEVTTWAYQGAFDDLQVAFKRYWDIATGKTPRPQTNGKPRQDSRPDFWPRFKAKNRTTPAFYLANQSLRFDGYEVTLPHIGKVNMAESLRFSGKVLAGRISYDAGYWWLSVQVETPEEPPEHHRNEDRTVYLDLGVRYLAKASNGKVYENPKSFLKHKKKLRRLQRRLDRQRRANNPDNYNPEGTVKAGPKIWHTSNRMEQTELAISRTHYRIRCARQEAAHQMTTEITRDYGTIIIEDLKPGEMIKDNPTADYLADAAIYEKKRQLTYKAGWNGGQVVTVEQFQPTNKRCSGCGFVNNDLKIGQEKWQCPTCQRINDKYNNSLMNIKELNTSPDYSNGDEKRAGANQL